LSEIPEFSLEEFFKEHPQAPGLIEDLQRLFAENGRLLIGGREKLFIKQCFSLMIDARDFSTNFSPAFLIEEEVEMYFSKAAQLSRGGRTLFDFLDHLPHEPAPWIFYESESPGILDEDEAPSKLFPDIYKNIILYFPFSSVEAMRQALSHQKDWRQGGFKAVFYQPYQLTFI